MRITKVLLVLGVVLGVVLPKSTVVLAEMGLIRANVIVICTGEGLKQIVLNEDGEPVEVSIDSVPCALTDAVDGSALAWGGLPYADLIELTAYLRPHEVHGLEVAHSTKFARAPPRV